VANPPPDAVSVAGRRIGRGEPCFLVAEIGVNHNGDVDLARRLIASAADAGADAVKFQTWITDKVVADTAPLAAYQNANLGSDAVSQREMLERLELSRPDFESLRNVADDCGVMFLSTPDEEESADFLNTLGLPMIKIGSGELTNRPFLRHVGALGKPVMLSTGMATLEEVDRAVTTLRAAGASELILMHCVSLYPAPPTAANLHAMETMEATFGLPVGFSDHTLGRDVAVAAVALGACALEKHITLSRDMEGPDHPASLEPAEFAELVTAVRAVESALGDGEKLPAPGELETRAVVRRRILTSRAVKAGTLIREDDVTLRRAGAGLEAGLLEEVLGKRARHDLPANEPVTAEAIE
jgi:N,N'-diacetyllegionaminate synthase